MTVRVFKHTITLARKLINTNPKRKQTEPSLALRVSVRILLPG